MPDVVRQYWLESERGWGCRPDGCSYHQTNDDCKAYIKEYWDRMPKERPDEYSRPSGGPEIVTVSDEIFEKVKASKNGIRQY